MATTSWVLANTGTNVTGIGTIDWSSPTNIHADDGTRSSATTIPPGGASRWLRAYFNFATGDIVPSGATINGIEVEVDTYSVNTYLVRFNAARLVIGGVIGGTDVPSMPSTNWGAASLGDAVITLGGASNLWSATPTASDVRGSTFGVAISAKNDEGSKNRNAVVDYIRMRIHYTVSSSFQAAWYTAPNPDKLLCPGLF